MRNAKGIDSKPHEFNLMRDKAKRAEMLPVYLYGNWVAILWKICVLVAAPYLRSLAKTGDYSDFA